MRLPGRFLVERIDKRIALCQNHDMKKYESGISFRVPTKLRDEAVRVAAERGERLTDVLRQALEDYIKPKP